MRRVKRAAVAVALFLAVAVALRAVPAMVTYGTGRRRRLPAPLHRLLVGRRSAMQHGESTAFPITDGSAVGGGDQIRVMFSTGSDGHAYVVARDSRGGLSMLFPGATVRGASLVRAGARHDAPGSDSWFTVDPQAGLEALDVVADMIRWKTWRSWRRRPTSG